MQILGQNQGKLPDSVETVSQSYLVELSVLAPSGQESVAEDMKAFAEQLKPLVQLDKIDYKRLPHVSLPWKQRTGWCEIFFFFIIIQLHKKFRKI